MLGEFWTRCLTISWQPVTTINKTLALFLHLPTYWSSRFRSILFPFEDFVSLNINLEMKEAQPLIIVTQIPFKSAYHARHKDYVAAIMIVIDGSAKIIIHNLPVKMSYFERIGWTLKDVLKREKSSIKFNEK